MHTQKIPSNKQMEKTCILQNTWQISIFLAITKIPVLTMKIVFSSVFIRFSLFIGKMFACMRVLCICVCVYVLLSVDINRMKIFLCKYWFAVQLLLHCVYFWFLFPHKTSCQHNFHQNNLSTGFWLYVDLFMHFANKEFFHQQ